MLDYVIPCKLKGELLNEKNINYFYYMFFIIKSSRMQH